MSLPVTLDDCGCCAGVTQSTPDQISNRPGLPALSARIGTYSSFFESMKAALSSDDHPALAALTARTSDDYAISLLDAFAVMADVLTFYQERYVQENYLRTATERRSILELARLIGYELDPGVAAATQLAFTLDDKPGSPAELDLPVGTKVQSVPGANQTAQTFETIEDLTARPEWSTLNPRLTQTHIPVAHDTTLWLQGAALNLKTGDTLVLVGDEKVADPTSTRWDFRRIAAVTVNSQAGTTRVDLEIPVAPASPPDFPAASPRVYALRRQGSLFGYNAPLWASLPVAQRIGEYRPTTPFDFIAGVYSGDEFSWADSFLPAGTTRIDLDAIYSQATLGSWIVLTTPGSDPKPPAQLFQITSVAETSVALYSLTGRCTELGIAGNHIEWFSPRNAVVFLQSEELPLAEQPITGPLDVGGIELDRRVAGLVPDRKLLVSGQRMRVTVAATGLFLVSAEGAVRALNPGDQLFIDGLGVSSGGTQLYTLEALDGFTGTVTASAAQLTFTPAASGDPMVGDATSVALVDDSDLLHTKISFQTPLGHIYDRATVTVYANVANATHGETVQEIMGGGDPSQSFQSFRLRQPPLTYVPAATPTGSATTLQVYANDVPWQTVDSLYAEGPSARVVTVRRDDAGNSTVLFGDGVSYGARPPAGSTNLRAQYRKGLGLAGNLDAGQLTNLMSRPLGLKAVTNPLPATGGADPEQLSGARDNAPLSVATLGRAVSILDYQDFARGFAGVAKAIAAWAWDGASRRVVLTVAGPEGAAIPPGSTTFVNLDAALEGFGDPTVDLTLLTYSPVTFRIGLKVLPMDPNQIKPVLATVEAALRTAFGFDARDFGQDVALSEVIEIVQAIDGVVAAQVTLLYRSDQPAGLNARLAAAAAPPGGEGAAPAELLTLDPAPFDLLGGMP